MKIKYIAIEREYGSGGTEIGRAVAEKCGVPCYGREILEAISEKLGVSVEEIESCEETATNSFIYSMFVVSQIQSGNPDMLTPEGHVHAEAQEAIRRFSEKGSAVFLGHCAGEALKNAPGVLRVFIRSDTQTKAKRITEKYGIQKEKAEATAKKYDKKRSNYFYANTMKKWGEASSYDLIMDSGSIGIDGCVDILCALLGEDA